MADARVKLPMYGSTDHRRDLETLSSRLKSEGVSFATITLPSLVKNLLVLLEHGSTTFPCFKIKKGSNYPNFLSGLFDVAINGDGEAKTVAFDTIYMVSSAFKKLKGPYKKTVLRKNFSEFLSVDAALGEIDWFSEPLFPILETARTLCSNFIKNIDVNDGSIRPRPGPGATNTPVEKTLRYEPHVMYDQINNVLPYQEWYYPTPWHACYKSRRFLALYNKRVPHFTSRFKFVPKTVGKPRGICIEQNEVQVLQQAYRLLLSKSIKAHPKLAKQLPLDDQRINAKLALESSETLECGTIDMSEASDRIARELVSWLFQNNQELHDVLMALSSRFVTGPKELKLETHTYRVNKYAPMGSGLCFPVMSLVHLFLVQAIVLNSSIQNRHTFIDKIYVYGDDIVLPSPCVQAVYDYLPLFGMKLNKDKSFYKSAFRESCGIHALNGRVVTPVFIKHVPSHHFEGSLPSLLQNEADLFERGFTLTAQYLRKVVVKLAQVNAVKLRYDFYVSKESNLLGFARSKLSYGDSVQYKSHFKRSWDMDTQQHYYRLPYIGKAIQRNFIRDMENAYLRWLWMYTEDSCKVSDSSGDHKVIWRKVPESALIGA